MAASELSRLKTNGAGVQMSFARHCPQLIEMAVNCGPRQAGRLMISRALISAFCAGYATSPPFPRRPLRR